MNALEVTGLSKTYRGRKGTRVEAVRELNLSVRQGEIFGFLGPNGAGKSTTIKAIVGLVAGSAGEITILGTSNRNPESFRRLGYLPENPSLFDFLTAEEYLRFVGTTFVMSETLMEQKSREVLVLLDLWEARKRQIRGYSKGMVQRLGLAQALLHDPELYILDEPMSGLDPLGRALVKKIIRDLKQKGKTVFFSTHITADVEVVCDRVGIIVNGKLEAVDTVERIMQKGIEGYDVQVRGLESGSPLMERYCLKPAPQPLCEGYVPHEQFNEFMQEIGRCGARLEFIETRRRDLETFFLDIVSRSDRPSQR